MAKIFRKIRQKLLSENKFSQYLLYAIGEIILVVIGILIALQMNIWNQDRKDNNALKEYLGKIKTHTIEDMYKLDKIAVGRTQIAELCKKARLRILDKEEDEDLILFMTCGAAFADFYFKPNIKSSGYFGKINNTPLDSLLNRYHSLVDEIAQNERSYNQYVVGQEAYLSTKFDLSLILASAFMPQDSLNIRATPQSEYYEDFIEYTSSAPYRNVISIAAWQFDTMVEEYYQLKDVSLTYAFYSFYVPSNDVVWADNMSLARELATDSDKNILLFFTGKWCVPCRIMKREVFADEDVMKAINSHVVPVIINLDDPNVGELVKLYKVSATPVTIFIDPKGEVVDYAVGKIGKTEFLEMLRNLGA